MSDCEIVDIHMYYHEYVYILSTIQIVYIHKVYYNKYIIIYTAVYMYTIIYYFLYPFILITPYSLSPQLSPYIFSKLSP